MNNNMRGFRDNGGRNSQPPGGPLNFHGQSQASAAQSLAQFNRGKEGNALANSLLGGNNGVLNLPGLNPNLLGMIPGNTTPILNSNNGNNNGNNMLMEGGMPGWTGLDLSRHGLRVLSPTIFTYSNITALYLNSNQLTSVPLEINRLVNLTLLDLSNNKLTLLHPQALGKLPRLEQLNVAGNPLSSPPQSVAEMGPVAVLRYLRERLPSPSPVAERMWVPHPAVVTPMHMASFKSTAGKFKVLCYNVLAEVYATQTLYHYCPAWALAWSYRKTKLHREIMSCDADIICLQEVETGQFEDFFRPEMFKAGYNGIFQAKTRYKLLLDYEKPFVDGCATFYRTSKFSSVNESLMEFQALASKNASLMQEPEINRLISKDNIAITLLLEMRDPGVKVSHMGNGRPQILVVNSHIHWNPAFSDVKLVQTQLLLDELSKHAGTPIVICGDFNSMPDSAVYQLLGEGDVGGDHVDLLKYRYGQYTEEGFRHNLPLTSAYLEVLGSEPSFTNYTADFVGSLDYIFYSRDTLICNGVLEPPSLSVVRKNTALPNPQFPSDHISLLAELELRPHRVNLPRPW